MSVGTDGADVTTAVGLQSWREGAAKQAILDFVDRTSSGSDAVPVEERVAVFDNDGTLWCEKPMPIQLDFILRRLGDHPVVANFELVPKGSLQLAAHAGHASLLLGPFGTVAAVSEEGEGVAATRPHVATTT